MRALLAALLLLAGCGYQTGSMMPDGISEVAVELFDNETRPETMTRSAPGSAPSSKITSPAW